MKLFTLLIIIATLTGCAGIDMTTRVDTYANKHLDSGYGVVVKGMTESGAYTYGSYGQTTYTYGDQLMYNANILGAGFGLKKEVADGFSVFGQFGWYQPQVSTKPGATKEAMNYYVEDKTNSDKGDFSVPEKNPYKWQNRDIELRGNVGGEVGMEYTRRVGNWTMGIGAGYRILELRQTLSMWSGREDLDLNRWEFDGYVDFSGWSVGLILRTNFRGVER